MGAEVNWCPKCGKITTPTGRQVHRSALLVGEYVEPTDELCDSCQPKDNDHTMTRDEYYELTKGRR